MLCKILISRGVLFNIEVFSIKSLRRNSVSIICQLSHWTQDVNCSGHLLNVLYTFNLRSVSKGVHIKKDVANNSKNKA